MLGYIGLALEGPLCSKGFILPWLLSNLFFGGFLPIWVTLVPRCLCCSRHLEEPLKDIFVLDGYGYAGQYGSRATGPVKMVREVAGK